MERKLAAILASDVVGYSRLMAEDEAGTLATLKVHREELFNPYTAMHHGRIVKLMGDGTLVEFASVVDAVQCAVDIQKAVAEHSGPIKLRIGINLGDIIIDGDDIYGDGVNIAARLEALAEPGGVCISSLVHESLGNRTEAVFADAGEHQIKNIDRPVRVWKWPSEEVASQQPITKAATEKPLVAIAGLQALSDDAICRQLASGLNRDLATEFGRFSHFDVITAAASVFSNAETSPLEFAREQRANYVLLGAIQTGGSHIRISVEIAEIETGKQVWSQSYDGDLENIFDLQDETVQRICGEHYHELMKHIAKRANARVPDGKATYDHYLESFAHVEVPTQAGMIEAKRACFKVLEADPGFALVYENLTWIHIHSAYNGWIADPQSALHEARRDALRGMSLDNTEAYAHSSLGLAEVMLGNHEKGLREALKAVRLSRNDIEQHSFLAFCQVFSSHFDEAVATCKNAFKRTTDWPPSHFPHGAALFALGKQHDAIPAFERFLQHIPEWNLAIAMRATCEYELGDTNAAKSSVTTLLSQSDHFRIAYLRKLLAHWDAGVTERMVDALTASGLP